MPGQTSPTASKVGCQSSRNYANILLSIAVVAVLLSLVAFPPTAPATQGNSNCTGDERNLSAADDVPEPNVRESKSCRKFYEKEHGAPELNIHIVTPSGGETFSGGTQIDIQWSMSGGKLNYVVWVNYTTDGFAHTSIVPGFGGVTYATTYGTAVWTLPNIDSNRCAIIITVFDADMKWGYDITDDYFAIAVNSPMVEWVSPASATKNVPIFSAVKVKFNMPMIAAQTINAIRTYPDPGGWNWTINTDEDTFTGIHRGFPYETEIYCIVAVSAKSKTGFNLQMSYNWSFTTSRAGLVHINSPGNSENYTAGSVRHIVWSINSTSPPYYYTCYFSADRGRNWNAIDSLKNKYLSKNGTVIDNWTVPNNESNECMLMIKVTDSIGQIFYARTNATYTVYRPWVQIIRPNGGESLKPGTVETILWKSRGEPGETKITLRYSTTGIYGSYTTIITGANDNGSYAWVVPAATSTNCYLNITMHDSSTPYLPAYDTSNASFRIASSSPSLKIAILSPNGGENWTVGDLQQIRWGVEGIINETFITIEYSKDGGKTYNVIFADIYGFTTPQYIWQVPYIGKTSAVCVVRIRLNETHNSDAVASDTSDVYFQIFVPLSIQFSVSVLSPSGGDNLTAGSVYQVKWSVANGIKPYGNMTISISTTGPLGPYAQITNTADGNRGYYNWTIPVLSQTSHDCFIMLTLSDAKNNSAVDYNTDAFTIFVPPKPTIMLIVPAGGEKWYTNTTKTIVWSVAGGLGNVAVDLAYSTTGISGTYTNIALGIPANTSSYGWLIPDKASSSCYIRATATDSAQRSAYDISDEFEIVRSPQKPQVTVLSPAKGEAIAAVGTYEIAWIRAGGKPPFTTRIEFSYNGGLSYITTAENATDNGIASSFVWTIPRLNSGKCYIRITVTDNIGQTSSGVSGMFAIINATSPLAGAIKGEVVSGDGKPIQNAFVKIVTLTSYFNYTNNLGVFIISNIPEGAYTITISVQGFPDRTIPDIPVTKGNVTDIGTIIFDGDATPILPQWFMLVLVACIFAVLLVALLLWFRPKRDSAENHITVKTEKTDARLYIPDDKILRGGPQVGVNTAANQNMESQNLVYEAVPAGMHANVGDSGENSAVKTVLSDDMKKNSEPTAVLIEETPPPIPAMMGEDAVYEANADSLLKPDERTPTTDRNPDGSDKTKDSNDTNNPDRAEDIIALALKKAETVKSRQIERESRFERTRVKHSPAQAPDESPEYKQKTHSAGAVTESSLHPESSNQGTTQINEKLRKQIELLDEMKKSKAISESEYEIYKKRLMDEQRDQS